jgi:DNA-binding response OmpR family regulator
MWNAAKTTGERVRVLLVEDDAMIGEAIKGALKTKRIVMTVTTNKTDPTAGETTK